MNLMGQSLGRYHILEQLGEGGMATVYKAYDTRLETDVAVKVIRTEKLTIESTENTLKRFEREAKALARLTHPNIVKVIDYGDYEGRPYLVMPYLPGGTLKQRLGKPLPPKDAARLLIPIARALEYAHRQGMIHRDVKPSNILITETGEPLLSDFGVAKLLEAEETMDLTGTGATVGTPEYMAPEQVTSKSVDYRADIYALGVVFYEMVTGRKPYHADTPMAVLVKHASEPLPRPKSFVSDLPDVVEQVLFKAMAKKPEDRFQTMDEFASVLERIVGGVPSVWPGKNSRRTNANQGIASPNTVIPLAKVGWAALIAVPLLIIIVVVVTLWIAERSNKNINASLDTATSVSNVSSNNSINSIKTNPSPLSAQTGLVIFTSEVGMVNQETIGIKNNSGGSLFLDNWSVQIDGQEVYRFPKIVILSGSLIFLDTGGGIDSDTTLHMNWQQPILHSGSVITIQDSTGKQYARYQIP